MVLNSCDEVCASRVIGDGSNQLAGIGSYCIYLFEDLWLYIPREKMIDNNNNNNLRLVKLKGDIDCFGGSEK